jgi:hypothetical protein
MQINDTVIGSVLIPLWFSASAVIEIVGGIILWCWLHRRGIELIFMLTGTPGYLELVYLRYCRNQGRSSKRVLIFRLISLINVVIAGIYFILQFEGK